MHRTTNSTPKGVQQSFNPLTVRAGNQRKQEAARKSPTLNHDSKLRRSTHPRLLTASLQPEATIARIKLSLIQGFQGRLHQHQSSLTYPATVARELKLHDKGPILLHSTENQLQ